MGINLDSGRPKIVPINPGMKIYNEVSFIKCEFSLSTEEITTEIAINYKSINNESKIVCK